MADAQARQARVLSSRYPGETAGSRLIAVKNLGKKCPLPVVFPRVSAYRWYPDTASYRSVELVVELTELSSCCRRTGCGPLSEDRTAQVTRPLLGTWLIRSCYSLSVMQDSVERAALPSINTTGQGFRF